MLSIKEYALSDEEITALVDEAMREDESGDLIGYMLASNVSRPMFEVLDDVDELTERRWPDDWEREAVKWPEPNPWHKIPSFERDVLSELQDTEQHAMMIASV